MVQQTEQIERRFSAEAHPQQVKSRPAIANPLPLGLLSFATGIFLVAILDLNARSVTTPNIVVGVLMFFGGGCQFIAGLIEFINCNTFAASLFCSFAAFNFSYAIIFLPGSGIMAAYTDTETGELRAEFHQALAMYLMAWFILSVIFTIGAMRASWVLFLDLVFLDFCFLFLACGNMVGNTGLLKAGYSMGLVVAFLTYYAGCAALWAGDTTPIHLPTFAMYAHNEEV
ncbi:GPR1/FUN34/yaaH family-domain-containing protein [Aspergillus pseudoustus]|uniref:GPR1/FUN34/yaaH family-domain-containing protein n=1 Tax=Aspergillus pseudoustus TaxID=1810923 RepID=A0ABR4IM51_9EURO